jgi:hypothetical protein
MKAAFAVLKDNNQSQSLGNAIKAMAKPNASADIVDVREGLVKR